MGRAPQHSLAGLSVGADGRVKPVFRAKVEYHKNKLPFSEYVNRSVQVLPPPLPPLLWRPSTPSDTASQL